MTTNLTPGIEEIGHYRTLIAIGLPLLGGTLAIVSSILIPRGKAKALLTGAYMLFASLGGAFLLFALVGAIMGEPRSVVVPLLVPGITLTVIMGLFAPESIREYNNFESRKLAAGIFRQS